VAWRVCLFVTKRLPAKTAEPIEMPFGMWARVGPSNHVLDGGRDPPRETYMPAVGIFNNTMWHSIQLLHSLVYLLTALLPSLR